MKWMNQLTRLFNIEYPVIQAPMFGVTTPAMVVAATRANCLGSLSLGDLNATGCSEAIRATKQLTGDPFAVNIFVHKIPALTNELSARYTKTRHFIETFALQHHLLVKLPAIDEVKLNSYHEQVEVIIEEGCKMLSFTFGNLDQQSIDRLKSKGICLIGTCTSVEEAMILEASGIDVICVQGIEAGGHRGSFEETNILQIGGLSLLAQVYDKVKVPLIYAGGIYNASTLLAAKTLGAQGFQVGSLLIASAESSLKDFEKQRLKKVNEKDIVLTKSFSGRYARGINNTFIETIESSEYVLPYPYQNKLTAELRKVAKEQKNADFVNIWAGQSLFRYSEHSTSEILRKLISDVELFS
ncbi:NAD(P)H-dependent flavin oxidoreductase [Gynurincola endophyticus]|uniref:NAD(P)H-dependent flavin oxidoreductase n=1 Tax=Gynurincola endophyticus TaxID=2479004 RepID=UPI000F8C7263|nr:nitronate monooxygenase [Gynurincola endophyticus]